MYDPFLKTDPNKWLMQNAFNNFKFHWELVYGLMKYQMEFNKRLFGYLFPYISLDD